jgi:hypothetical protein
MLDSARPSSVEPMQAAIQATLTTIRNRARLYRNLVVCVSVVVIGSAVVAAIFRSVIPLIAFSMLVPLVGLYFVLDNRSTRLWGKHLLELWSEGKVDLGAFSAAMGAYPFVPRGTLEGMLSALPIESAEKRPSSVSEERRKALLEQFGLQTRRQERRTVLATLGLLGMLVCLGSSILLRSGVLLACFVASFALWLGSRTT